MDFLELGQLIAKIRKDKKISQQTLVDDLHISRATLSSFENGRGVDIGLKKIIQIFDYLDYEICARPKSAFPSFEELLDE